MIIVCYFEIAQTMYLSCPTQFTPIKDSPLLKAAGVNGRKNLPAVGPSHSHPAFLP